MKKLFFFFSLLFTVLYADVYDDVNFTSTEVNMTLLLVNHSSYSVLNSVINNSYLVNNILNDAYKNRSNGGITSITQLVNDGLSSEQLYDLKQFSYKWTSDLIINPKFGTTYPQTNFLYALSGILIGFIVMFGFIHVVF